MRRKPPASVNGLFPMVNTRVTREFKRRLQRAVKEKQAGALHQVTEGEILCELVQYLPPVPEEDQLDRRPASQAQIKSKAKGRTA
jgi:hypothetical protein